MPIVFVHQKVDLPFTKNLALRFRGDTDIRAVGEFVAEEAHPADRGNSQNSNNGVGGDIREPSLGEGIIFLHLTGNGRQVGTTRSEGHVGSTGE